MKTDELIDMLSTNVEPVDSRRPWRRLAAAVGISASAAFGLMLPRWACGTTSQLRMRCSFSL